MNVTVEPPSTVGPALPGRSVDDHPVGPESFDIELFERLNDEYAAEPVVRAPLAYDHRSLVTRSTARLQAMHAAIDLANKRVLAFGCGSGYEVWLLSHAFGCEAFGIDIVERSTWGPLAYERTHFVLSDVARDQPFEANDFDRIISTNVFEHVAHPRSTFEALFRVLRPGGLAFISAQLHRGPLASHRYREVTFPWPHLLFEDDVFREFYRRRSLPEQTAAWVNHLTWEQYRLVMEGAGFKVLRERLRGRPVDEPFYRRFEAILGRYPRADLERDFFDVVLRKPGRLR